MGAAGACRRSARLPRAASPWPLALALALAVGLFGLVGMLGVAVLVPATAKAAEAASPWPSMRHDSHNTGAGTVRPRYDGGAPWHFQTGSDLFITPVIDGRGTIYFGSADHYFYALRPNGKLQWKFHTGNIIDAAAALNPRQTAVTIGSADENLYDLSTSRRRLSAKKRVIWKYHATAAPASGQLVDWWEGDVAYGPDGNIYTGNTGGTIYSFTPSGHLRWTYPTGDSVWTMPAFASNGDTYWGSVDRSIYQLSPTGTDRWSYPTLGFVTSSPAIGSDGTVYIGSFDSNLYAMNPVTGTPKWTFGTNDSIYASPALGTGSNGQTDAIYVASTDGSIYRISPQGKLVWAYDTGEPIRSSPVLGPGPTGTPDQILYVGSSDGSLYAINTATGTRRWSFSTISTNPTLRDRHELNSSPALGRTGVYIGSEDGALWYVPYDYCLHRHSSRCDTSPSEPYAANLSHVYGVTPGGTTVAAGSEGPLPTSTEVTGRLIVRQNGSTVPASMLPVPSTASLVSTEPHFEGGAELSGDGRYVFLTPDTFLHPSTTYHVTLSGTWGADGKRVADYTTPGTWTKYGHFDGTFSFRTAAVGGSLPLHVHRNAVTAFELYGLEVPLPAFLPSVNEIGFDSYTLLMAPLSITPPGRDGVGSILLWVTEAREAANGSELADPSGELMFPLAGQYQGSTLRVSAQNTTLTFSFGQVPLQDFDLGFRLRPSLQVDGEASLYAQAECADIPNYSVATYITGICNFPGGVLPAAGTFLTRRYVAPARSHHRPAVAAASRRPSGLSVSSLTLKAPTQTASGALTATLALSRGASYRSADHRIGLLLVDSSTDEPLGLNYTDETVDTDAHGNIHTVSLSIPAGTSLPAHLRAYVIADVFPLRSESITASSQ